MELIIYSKEEIDGLLKKLSEVVESDNFDYKHYRKLLNVVERIPRFDVEDFSSFDASDYAEELSEDSVIGYLNNLSDKKLQALLSDYTEYMGLPEVDCVTLDDEDRLELVIKLYKKYSTILSLEKVLGEKLVKELRGFEYSN